MVSVFFGEVGRVVLPLAIIIHCHQDRCPYIQTLWIILIHGPTAMLYVISPLLIIENTMRKIKRKFSLKKVTIFVKYR